MVPAARHLPTQNFRSHPAASIFPLMVDGELSALAEDIRQHGQREPIVLAAGAILDGRNRWLACEKVGVQPVAVEWDGVGSELTFVVSKNLHRRHLNISQRALIAAEIANSRHGGDRTSEQGIFVSLAPVDAQQAGTLMGVSRPLVLRARTVLARGTAEEIEAVRQGSVAVSPTARKIWDRERKAAAPAVPAKVIQFPPKARKPPIKLPDGMTPEQAARKALALRAELGSAERVSDTLGIRRERCMQMMDIVMIADRTDLSVRDTEIAAAALREMNAQQARLDSIHKTIQPIMQRIWGDRKGSSRTARENNRSERFEHGIGILIQACLNGPKIEVPHLSPERSRKVLVELQQAIQAVKALMVRIEGINQ